MEVCCPLCKGTNLSYILFGYPSEGMIRAESSGHFRLGGSIVKEEHWFCKDCNKAVYIKSKMPCAYCEKCKSFLASEDVEIFSTERTEVWKCLKCNSVVKRKETTPE